MLALCAANAAYLAGLESALPAGQACIVAGTGAPLMRMLRRSGIVATALDEHEDVLRAVPGALSGGVVLGAAPVMQLLQDHGCTAVLPFKSGARVRQAAEWSSLTVLASEHRLTRQLENKLALSILAAEADARVPDTVTVRLDADLATAARRGDIALPRVFQPAVGFAGAGTLLLRTARDVEALVEHPPTGVAVGKLVEFVDGEPVTVNGVVVPPGMHGAGDEGAVLVGMVARQLTGIPRLTPAEFGSCGNDWTRPPAYGTVVATRALARNVGHALAARGFAGSFGIDVVLPADGGMPVLIEVNPRWTASLTLQVELQMEQGLPTLLDAHLASFGWRAAERAPLSALEAAYGGADAACTVGVPAASTVIAFNASGRDVHVDPACEPGVWRTVHSPAGALDVERVRDGWRLADLDGADELLVLPQGTVRPVSHGGYLVRIARRDTAAADARADQLEPRTRAIIDAVAAKVVRPA